MSSSTELPNSPTACFAVQARAEPGAMPRVLELFAKRGLVPSQWHSALAGPAHDELHIDIQVEGMARELAEYVARCLRQLPDVAIVLTSEKRYAQSA
jgi:acetolactate synthase small subunit